MPQAKVGDITLEWEAFGEPSGEPLLLVMGLSAQMVLWPAGFCERLAARGYRVVRFDNRDVGRSTKLHHLGVPKIPMRIAAKLAGITLPAPYTLSDMAKDAVGLMDTLGWQSAHVVGMSMGGMIAQTMAIEHAARVKSLVSFASSSGDYGLPLGTRDAMQVLLATPPTEREAAIRHGVGVLRAIGSPAHFDEAHARATVELAMSRSTYRLGAGRQLAAILADEPRSPRLRRVRVPTTVIHGRIDPLLPLPHGEATARAVDGARLVVLDTLGHDIPEALWPELTSAIHDNAQRARRGPAVSEATASRS